MYTNNRWWLHENSVPRIFCSLAASGRLLHRTTSADVGNPERLDNELFNGTRQKRKFPLDVAAYYRNDAR